MITAFRDSWTTVSDLRTLRNLTLDVIESEINAFITVNGFDGNVSNRSQRGPSILETSLVHLGLRALWAYSATIRLTRLNMIMLDIEFVPSFSNSKVVEPKSKNR